MSKQISNGIDQLVKNTNSYNKQIELHEKSWAVLRNKLNSILLSTNAIKRDELIRLCQAIDAKGYNERYQYILENWGINYAEKSKPILHQLETVEHEIAKRKANG